MHKFNYDRDLLEGLQELREREFLELNNEKFISFKFHISSLQKTLQSQVGIVGGQLPESQQSGRSKDGCREIKSIPAK